MKKHFFSLLALMLVTFVSVSLVSCGDDDDEKDGGRELSANEIAANLIGEWRMDYTYHDYDEDYPSYYLFKVHKEGLGYWYNYSYYDGRWHEEDDSDFTYTYDARTRIITIIYPGYSDWAWAGIKSATKNSMVVIYEGDEYTVKRVK